MLNKVIDLLNSPLIEGAKLFDLDSLKAGVFLRPGAVLMSTNNGAVYHDIFAIGIFSQMLENMFA